MFMRNYYSTILYYFCFCFCFCFLYIHFLVLKLLLPTLNHFEFICRRLYCFSVLLSPVCGVDEGKQLFPSQSHFLLTFPCPSWSDLCSWRVPLFIAATVMPVFARHVPYLHVSPASLFLLLNPWFVEGFGDAPDLLTFVVPSPFSFCKLN